MIGVWKFCLVSSMKSWNGHRAFKVRAEGGWGRLNQQGFSYAKSDFISLRTTEAEERG